ncbi:MAG: dTDP-4-dehydrorhamnose 3,5-epimerase family protein [Betaproteobacteria bacterium]|nr:dTDP-4-dehydrorhamnose 3,5-epimerase family protein [Betaproteobacteria bacterium]
MIFTPIPIAGAFLVALEPREDRRGSFARAFCKREFAQQGIDFDIAQCNLARTTAAGVVRGLHFQAPPAEERKLVRCVVGAVFDALVDMRPSSPTRRKVFHVRLDSDQGQAVFVPSGVAHGYQALENGTTVLYMTDQYYAPGLELGVRYSDPAVAIPWPLEARDVADRDKDWPLLD